MRDKMREEFEVALLEEKCKSGDELVKADWIERGSDGEYRSYFVRGAWWAWQASRAALVVELPETISVYAHPESDREQVFDPDDVREAIHAAGVKTK